MFIEGYQSGELVKEPTLVTENLSDRVKELYNRRFLWNLWTKLIRRDFIMGNGLRMIDANAHDANYTCCLVCSAGRYVRVPNIVNFYRVVETSMSHRKDDVSKTIHKWINTLTKGFTCLDDLLNKLDFYKKNPAVKFLALETWVRECCGYLTSYYAQIPPYQLDELIRREFEKFHDNPTLTAFLFSRMNVLNVNLNHQGAMIQQMNAHIQQQNQIIRQQQEQIQQLQAQIQK